MRAALVGYTGFVGSNLFEKGDFCATYNSKNIEDSYGTMPDLCVYAGVRAEKYLANREPSKDMEMIREAERNIEKMAPKKLVLISTIDVFDVPDKVDEFSRVETDKLQPYGFNRYCLEQWVREHYPDALIVRLPGLFGKSIKKNFIYDYINVIPSMLTEQKFSELSARDGSLKRFYSLQDNGFYKVTAKEEDKGELRDRFRALGFTALNFTDSRSAYQFYDLDRLWDDIETALENGITLLHTATEPVTAGELHRYLCGREFVNEVSEKPASYDYRTRYDGLFGGKGGYICSKAEVLEAIGRFVESRV